MRYQGENNLADTRWFAVWTRSRQEKAAATMLGSLGVPHYLPLKSEQRQWSDRKQTVAVPLFSGYLFVRVDLSRDSRLEVLKTPGIVGFVGNQTGPLPIPDAQIDAVRTVMDCGVECATTQTDKEMIETIREGHRVRVVRGALAGLEGMLVRANSASRLVISVDMIQQSLAVEVSRQDVEPWNVQAA